jgi:hypothetical protein
MPRRTSSGGIHRQAGTAAVAVTAAAAPPEPATVGLVAPHRPLPDENDGPGRGTLAIGRRVCASAGRRPTVAASSVKAAATRGPRGASISIGFVGVRFDMVPRRRDQLVKHGRVRAPVAASVTTSVGVTFNVVDFDTALDEQLLDVAVRQVEAQVQPNGDHDDVRRKPQPGER